jgi:hypothetical protein
LNLATEGKGTAFGYRGLKNGPRLFLSRPEFGRHQERADKIFKCRAIGCGNHDRRGHAGMRRQRQFTGYQE